MPNRQSVTRSISILVVCTCCVAGVMEINTAADPDANRGGPHWLQFCGSSARNNVADAQELPSFWDVESKTNVKWVARLGSQSYGSPVVANGKVFIGTNNGAGYLGLLPGEIDLGCLLCFRESDGEFLWQHSNRKLSTGRIHDHPLQGVCSTPIVEGDRLWYVSNRGQVVCLDTDGFHDGEDDGALLGGGEQIFEVSVNLASPRELNATVRSLLAACNVQIPAPIGIRDGKKDDEWIVRSLCQERKDYFRVTLQDGQLRITDLGEQPKQIIQIGVDVLENIDAGILSPALQHQFKAHGIGLSGDPQVEVIAPAKAWEIRAVANGSMTTFQLNLDRDRLTCGEKRTGDNKRLADTVWSFDMMRALGVSQHSMANCSPTIWGDVLFVCTSNGVDESHLTPVAPDAPSFLALNKNTGEVLWTDNSPGENILHGQWSSPAVAEIDGIAQVIFAGGDGWVYSFRADRWNDGKPDLLWKFDCNLKESTWILGGRGTRNNVIAMPVIYDGLVYITVGQEPEGGEGDGCLWCIDPRRRGDISAELVVDSRGHHVPHRRLQAVNAKAGEKVVANPHSGVVWKYQQFDMNRDGEISYGESMHRSLAGPAIKDDLLFIADMSGIVHCLAAKSGKPHWTCDLLAASWAIPLIVGNQVFVADEDGDVAIFALSADPAKSVKPGGKGLKVPKTQVAMEGSIYSTPVAVNGVLFLSTRDRLYAIARN